MSKFLATAIGALTFAAVVGACTSAAAPGFAAQLDGPGVGFVTSAAVVNLVPGLRPGAASLPVVNLSPLLAAPSTRPATKTTTPATRKAWTTNAPASSPVDPPGVITSHWADLYLNGAPYRFLSIDAPSAATDWSINWGCGAMATDAQLDAFFASLPPHSLVPFWAFQAMAFNDRTTHQIDFSAIDRVFAAAARHGQYLIPELEHQQGDCSDGHWKDESWYAGGYRTAFDTDTHGLEPLSYWQYLQLIVPRYRSNPALGMWGLMVEPEAQTCDASAASDCAGHSSCNESVGSAALRSFFDTVGAEVHQLDPEHLTTAGSIGGGQCGWAGSDFAVINSSPGIDVCEVHDYNWATTPITPEAVSDIQTCKALGKPLIVGETGLSAASDTQAGCPQTDSQRAASFRTRIGDYFSAGASGLALWSWALAPTAGCSYYIAPNDPVMSVIDHYPV